MTNKITLDTLEFFADALTGWVFTDLTDWWGQVDDKVSVTERPQGHGAFPVSRVLRMSRALSFNVAYLGASQTEVEDAFDVLSAVGAEEPVRMTVETEAGASFRTVSVRVSKAADHKARSTGLVAVDCVARDPRRYQTGTWVETGTPTAGTGVTWPLAWPLTWPGGGNSGRIALVNSGKAPSSPVFELVGGSSTSLITCVDTGARVGFDRPIPVGKKVVIDVAERQAMIDGNDVSRWLRWREWEDVPAESSRRYQLALTGGSGSPLLRGKVDSAWW